MFFVLLFCAGCSGSIKKPNNVNSLENITLSSIDVIVTEVVQKDLGADPVFNAETLQKNIENQLNKASLIDANSRLAT